jgi:hypothetical protein
VLARARRAADGAPRRRLREREGRRRGRGGGEEAAASGWARGRPYRAALG